MATKKPTINAPLNQEAKLDLVLSEMAETREAVEKLTKRVNRFLLFTQLKSLFWLLLLVASIIATVIYLPPLLQDALKTYQGLVPGLNF